MKYTSIIVLILFMLTSCKSDKKEVNTSETENELTIAQKIANAHGYKNWKNVKRLRFNFSVDRDSIKGQSRSWVWHPKEDHVKMTSGKRTFDYRRNEITNKEIAADQAFINDKFWLLVPFQLIWDTSATISDVTTATSPINNIELQMVSITYPSQGGYTPGDAYDIYFDSNYIIREWTFRKKNAQEPTLSTTFENYNNYNGLLLASDHKQADRSWNLKLTNIEVLTQ